LESLAGVPMIRALLLVLLLALGARCAYAVHDFATRAEAARAAYLAQGAK
jgi:hypothetical protein